MGSKELITKLSTGRRMRPFYMGGLAAATADGSKLFTPCGAVVVVSGADGTETARLGEEEEGASEVTCVGLSLDEEHLVVAYRNLLLRLWDIQNAQVERCWRSGHKSPVLALAFGTVNDVEGLASGGADGSVRVVGLESQTTLATFPGAAGVVSALVWPKATEGEESLLFAGSGEGQIRRLGISSRSVEVVLEPSGSPVTCLLADNDVLVSCSRNGRLHYWATPSSKTPKVLETGEEGLEWAVFPHSLGGFAPAQTARKKLKKRESVVITGGSEGTLGVWDLQHGNQLYAHKLPAQQSIAQIISCPAASVFLALTGEQNIVRLNRDTLDIRHQLVGFNDEVLCLCFVGANQLAAGTNSPLLRLYSLGSEGGCRLLEGHKEAVLCLARLDESRFVSGSKDNTARLWRLCGDSAVCMAIASGHTHSLPCLAAASRCQFLLTGSEDTTLKLWGLGKETEVKREETENIKPSALSASVTVVAGQKGLTSVDVSPNDRLVASGSLEKSVRLWHLNWKAGTGSLSPAGTLPHPRGVWALKFSPSDQLIATAAGDGQIRLFGLSDQTCLKSFEGHQSAAISVAFVSNGLQIVSTDTGGVLRLWSLRKGECAQTEEAHEDKTWALAIAPTNAHFALATGGADAEIRLYRDVTEEEKKKAEAERQLKVSQDQRLSNLLIQGQVSEALLLSLDLNRPYSAYNVLKELGDDELTELLPTLSQAKTGQLLEYVVSWNSRLGTSELGQRVLFTILSTLHPQDFLALPNAKDLVTGLLPYTRRHFERLSRLNQSAAFLEFSRAQASL